MPTSTPIGYYLQFDTAGRYKETNAHNNNQRGTTIKHYSNNISMTYTRKI